MSFPHLVGTKTYPFDCLVLYCREACIQKVFTRHIPQNANFSSIIHGCHYVAPSPYTRALTSWTSYDSGKLWSPSWISGSRSGVAPTTELISDQWRHIKFWTCIARIAGWCDKRKVEHASNVLFHCLPKHAKTLIPPPPPDVFM
jgi:hypothetical protein